MSAKTFMTKDEFLNLKAGDLLVWRGAYLRTVIEAPKRANGAIVLAIRRRSWTGRIKTVRFYNDLKWVCFPAAKRIRNLMLLSEVEVLKSLGFDVRREVKREVEDEFSRLERLDEPLCKNASRIAELAGIKLNRRAQQ